MHAGDKIDSGTDPATGLPVYSLYGATRKPTPEMLKDIDVLVYDIQDIGCRSFTYISTMGLAMEAAAENNIEFVVLDRPNPLGGLKIEGCIVEDGFFSFVSQYKIPYVYGLTCGELALMLNADKQPGKACKLHVVKMKGWKRKMDYTQTGLQWIPPSPHIPHAHSAFFYPVSGIFGELGYASIGVGYTIPFQMFAAPWIDAVQLADAMDQGGRADPTDECAAHTGRQLPADPPQAVLCNEQRRIYTRRTGAYHRLSAGAPERHPVPRYAGNRGALPRPRRVCARRLRPFPDVR